MPGPASSVEDRSLRKNFVVRGDRTSIPAEAIFSDAIYRNRFDGDPTIGRVLPISQPRLGMAVAASLLSEEGT